MIELPASFAVQCVDGERWLVVAPSNYGPRWGDPGAVMLACRKWGVLADGLLLPEHHTGVLLLGANDLSFGARSPPMRYFW
jgi:hypothetical protein